MSTKNSGIIKSQHCCTGSGVRLTDFKTHEKYYEHFVEKKMIILENDRVKTLWDFSIQAETKIGHDKPDLILVEKKERTWHIVDVACLFDPWIKKKEKHKVKTLYWFKIWDLKVNDSVYIA